MLPLPSLEIFIYCLETSVIPEHYSIFKLHVLLQYSLVERIPVIDTLAVAMTYRPTVDSVYLSMLERLPSKHLIER